MAVTIFVINALNRLLITLCPERADDEVEDDGDDDDDEGDDGEREKDR